MTQYEKMTKTPVPRLILKLSVPTVISMLVTNIYNLVDTAFVGQLGTSATGAVGIVFGFMSFIQAVGFLFGQGAGSIISRSLGQKNAEKASVHASLGFTSSFTAGLMITGLGFLFLDEIIMFLGSTETIAPYAKDYICYILIASPFMSSCLTLNNYLRYEGKAALGMTGLMTGAVLNMIGDPVLMFGLGMGISGAGLSTAISQFISWCILVGMFLSGKTETKLSLGYLRKGTGLFFLNIVTTGFPSLLRQGLNSISTIILNSSCAVYGDAAVAAMSVVSRIVFFAFSVALGIGQGFQPVSGFNYGAEKYLRLRGAYRFTIIVSECLIIFGSIFLVIFADSLIGVFRDDPEVIVIGARALRLQAVAQTVLPPCMTSEMLFQSTGQRLSASILTSLRSGVLLIPLLFIMASLRGLAGIQEAQPLALLLSVPITIPFAVSFFRKLPKEDKPDPPDTEPDASGNG